MKIVRHAGKIVVTLAIGLSLAAPQAFADSEASRDILKQGLLGAGTGALAAGMSGGKAGKGALIGAGTNVIGGALLGFLTDSPGSGQQVAYAPAPVAQSYYQAPPVQTVYYQQPQPEPVYYAQPASMTYYSQPAVDPNKQILKQGLLGAGVGAISSSASGGKAGTGALIGAGTNVVGGALLDMLTTSPAPVATPASYSYYGPQSYYSQPMPNRTAQNPSLSKHIIRKFDAEGNVVSEEEFYQ